MDAEGFSCRRCSFGDYKMGWGTKTQQKYLCTSPQAQLLTLDILRLAIQ